MAKKKGKFTCATCGRIFGMAAHLGRHMSTVHARAGRPKAHRSRVKPIPHPTHGPLINVMADMLYEFTARRAELAAQRATLDSQAAALDRVIAAFGKPAAAKVRRGGHQRRAAQETSLPAHILRVLRAHRRPMAIKAVTAAVLKAGYKSKNKELPKTVGKYLARLPGVIRVARGVFRLK
jgi:hypothetical protein